MSNKADRLKGVVSWILATLIYLGIACGLAASAAWLIGRFSPRSLAIGLMLTGILALLLGAGQLSALGISRDATYQLSQSVTDRTLDGHMRREFAEAFGGGRFMSHMAVVALACLALSVLVETGAR